MAQFLTIDILVIMSYGSNYFILMHLLLLHDFSNSVDWTYVLDWFLKLLDITIWPIVVLILLNNFKVEIGGFIGNLKSVFLKNHDTCLGVSTEQPYNGAKELNVLGEELHDPAQCSRLKKDFEVAIKNLDFEKIYSIIFGSQLNLLLDLSKEQLGYSFERLYLYYRYVQNTHTAFNGVDITVYLSFLQQAGLIDITNNQTSITPKGLEFLKYISKSNYSLNKLL